ncbi:zincin [Periconia macrospinosa]|uniref:Zincin n=1 Tax=Periconia macrospinosa TaxID=97972 RepID=A0A2V1DFC7_9PLEO|nr:zincin [Periconia macrospinosa]
MLHAKSPAAPSTDSTKVSANTTLHNDAKLQPRRMVIDTTLLWPGPTLCIKFLDGSQDLHDRVKRIIEREYQPLIYLDLNFIDTGESNIRISFNTRVNESYVGTAARVKGPEEPTMNLHITTSTPQKTLERSVLHEFGHALGALHEHSSPDCPIIWNEEEVYKSYPLDKKSIYLNVLHKESSADIRYSQFDPTSIMMYQFSQSLTRNGRFTQLNTGLSDTDKHFMSIAYPKPKEGHAEHPPITQRVRTWFYNLVDQTFSIRGVLTKI